TVISFTNIKSHVSWQQLLVSNGLFLRLPQDDVSLLLEKFSSLLPITIGNTGMCVRRFRQ
ncbi:MAG: hypothetical protein VYC58_04265, partial [Pseudomonadota bacterium]|nr:hypothetical protein [Pseudomonadota bacterium]